MLKKLKLIIWPIIVTTILIAIFVYLIKFGLIENDLGKTLLGTFAAAWLAFLSNQLVRFQIQNRDDLAAARRALLTISSQMDDFLNYRYGIQYSMNILAEAMANVPEWCYAKPIGFNFNPSNVFDFKSLRFLLTSSTGRRAYERLQLIERTYLDIMARHADLNSSAIDIQKELARLHQSVANFFQSPL